VLRGRTTVEADLKDPTQRDQVLELIGAADVLVEGFRPGVTERMGLGPDECMGRNPRLVYARMTGWGQSGPLSDTAGHDINYLSLTGALHAIGPVAQPLPPLNLVGDYGGGSMFLVLGVLAALWERTVSGKGQVVDVAMVDGISALQQQLLELRARGIWNDKRGNNILDGAAPYYRTYRCADSKFIAVGAIEPQFYAQLIMGLGISSESLPDRADRSQWPVITGAFAAAFSECPRDHWTQVFGGTDACVTPVLDFAEAPHHPHMADRKALVDADGAVVAAPAPRFSRSVAETTEVVRPTNERLGAVVAAWSAPDLR
jgi:alpha-methylacyl-CoA racemase